MQTERSRLQGSQILREVHPLGMRIVVQVQKDNNKTEAGLYLPEGAKQQQQESLLGEVIEVATALEEDYEEEDFEVANISGIPLGALVLIPFNSGIKVPWNDDLRIVETKDVLAIVDEVDMI